MATSPRMSWNSFISIPNGTKVFNHGYSECVALANLYHENVIGGSFVPVASAYQWWTQFGNYATLTQNYTQSSSPVAGSIFVSRGGPYNSVDGHIGIVTAVHGNGTFDTMEQNASYRYVWRYNRGMSGVYGFLSPKNNPASPPVPTPATNHLTKLRLKRSKEQETMLYIYITQGATTTFAIFRLGEKGTWWQFIGQEAANRFATQIGNAAPVALETWNDLKNRHL